MFRAAAKSCVRSILSGARTSPSRNVLVFGTSAAAHELECSGYTIIRFTHSNGDGNPGQSLPTISRVSQLVAEKNSNRRVPSLASRFVDGPKRPRYHARADVETLRGFDNPIQRKCFLTLQYVGCSEWQRERAVFATGYWLQLQSPATRLSRRTMTYSTGCHQRHIPKAGARTLGPPQSACTALGGSP
jgi:hypothetical protein